MRRSIFPTSTSRSSIRASPFSTRRRLQIARFPNVYVGLESTAALAVRHPRKFARILGEFLMIGGAKKLFWSSGASSPHPRPVARCLRRLEMPPDMIEGDGYPPLTTTIKADILGRNYAALHGIDRPASTPRSPMTRSAGAAATGSPSPGRGCGAGRPDRWRRVRD